MYRFFLYFLVRTNAEQAAEMLRREDYEVWRIQPGWDDPFSRLEVRRRLAAANLAAAVEHLRATASRFHGEYSDCELCA